MKLVIFRISPNIWTLLDEPVRFNQGLFYVGRTQPPERGLGRRRVLQGQTTPGSQDRDPGPLGDGTLLSRAGDRTADIRGKLAHTPLDGSTVVLPLISNYLWSDYFYKVFNEINF